MDKAMHVAGCPDEDAMDDFMSDMMDDMHDQSMMMNGQKPVVAMAYVPWQNLNTLYDPEGGLCRGTIFPELDKPWMPGGVCCD